MSFQLLWLPLAFAGLDWLAVARGWKPVEYIAKPGTMIALLLWGWLSRPAGSPADGWLWFAGGVVASLAGDVLLMLPKEQFLGGLVAFLGAHLAYIVGFNLVPPPVTLPAVVLGILVGVTAWRIYRRISNGLESKGARSLQKPVGVYTLVIALMVFSASMTLLRDEWEPLPALLVSAGGLLFFLSDTMLAWDRFVAPLTGSRLKVMITYHLGQIAIMAGSVLFFFR